jgi:hypothetical protein
MAKLYRLSVPINPATKDALDALALAANSSAGATAGSFLDELAPHFVTLAEAYTAARIDPLKAARIVTDLGNNARKVFEEEQLDLLNHLEGKSNAKTNL